MFSDNYETWVYEDALRFLHRDDLSDLGITHVHVAEGLGVDLAPSAERLLDDPRHFRLLAEIQSDTRHRVYEVLPDGGATDPAPTSYRRLRRLIRPDAPIATLGSLQSDQLWMIFSGFADHEHLLSPVTLRFERATRIPLVETPAGLPQRGMVILPGPLEPTALGLSRDEALWVGHGLRAYDVAADWSPVLRVGTDSAALPGPARSVCETAGGEVDLRLLGEPGTVVTAGSTDTVLTGIPQVVRLSAPNCGAFTLSADAAIAPFVQIRPRHASVAVDSDAPIAGLGFDSIVDGERAVIGLWYRNPSGVPFVTGTEFRLYKASPLGVGLDLPNANLRTNSLRWWPGPAALRASEQTARIEFDARRLEVNGDAGGGSLDRLVPGETYLLAVTVAGAHPQEGHVEIQHVIPVARVVLSESGVDYDVFSGMVTIEHRAPGTLD